jgi:hypothetical protein
MGGSRIHRHLLSRNLTALEGERDMNRNRTYQAIAQQALAEYAETVIDRGIGYGSSPKSIAGAAWEAMVDALVEAGADINVMGAFFDTEAEDYVEDLDDEEPSDNAALLRQAAEILLEVAESL